MMSNPSETKALLRGSTPPSEDNRRRLLDFLGEHQVPLQLAMPLYRKFGDRALEVIRGNPYLLVDEELGVIAVRGAVPGPKGGVVILRSSVKKVQEKKITEAGRVNPQKASARVNPQKASARNK